MSLEIKKFPILGILLPLGIALYFFLPRTPKPAVIGIDLGTTFSSVGAFHPKEGTIDIFGIDKNNQVSVPSIVYLTGNHECNEKRLSECEILIGREAIEKSSELPKHVLYDSKRFIGLTFDFSDPSTITYIKNLLSLYPFDMVFDRATGKPFYVIPRRVPAVEYVNAFAAVAEKKQRKTPPKEDGEKKDEKKEGQDSAIKFLDDFDAEASKKHIYLSPEAVSSLLLREMVRKVIKKLGRKVEKSVITVPADFGISQRDATVRAAELAKLKVLRLVTEPTAASLAHGLHEKKEDKIILIADFGGGTFDVSVLEKSEALFYVLSISGNNRLGGQNLTENLLTWFANNHLLALCNWVGRDRETEIGETGREGEMRDHLMHLGSANLQVLRNLMEEVKISLTDVDKVARDFFLSAEPSYGNQMCRSSFEFTREHFEMANDREWKKLIAPIKNALQKAHLSKYDVSEIVFVGGSSKIPKVRSLIQSYFTHPIKVHLHDNPELSVVTGASIQAGILGNSWPITISVLEVDPTEDVIKRSDVLHDDEFSSEDVEHFHRTTPSNEMPIEHTEL